MQQISIFLNIIFFTYSLSSPIFWTEDYNVLIPKNTTYINRSVNNVENVTEYRLPTSTYPLKYHIHLYTDIHKNIFNFTGTVDIQLQVREDCEKIVIHSRQLEIIGYELVDTKANKSYELKYKYDKVPEFSIFELKNPKDKLEYNQILNLKINYTGILREDFGGFYRSKYTNSQNKTIYLATTQFESTDARHGFPCYDEPALKATYTISIKHGKEYRAISNMPELIHADEGKDYKITKFKETPKMSTYLVAFIISNFVETTAPSIDDPEFIHGIFSRPESKQQQAFGLQSSVKILHALENYLQTKYSLPKMDQVAVPDFAAGAMENWGLVTYREELLLYDEKYSTVSTKTGIATTVAHEYGHQWFGNLVSPKWWKYLWLNEGFASLFAYIGSDMAYPEWNLMEYFMVAEYQRALSADAGKTPRPMTFEVNAPREIVALFDTVSYSKAACVLRMMQNVLTDKVFAKALKNYLEINKYNSTEENDLFTTFQQTADTNAIKLPASIAEIMGSWTNQGGYPILKVTRDYTTNGSFTIKQQGFYNNPSDTMKDDRVWWIPFNFVSANKPDFQSTLPDDYMRAQEKHIVQSTPNKQFTSSDWLILNKQNTGYYRINYDAENWQLIANGLKENYTQIHTYNRAQLIFDAFRFSINNQLNYNILFDLLTYLETAETSYAVWSTVNTVFTYFHDYLRNDPEYYRYQFYVQNLIKNIYAKYGIIDDPKDQHFDKYIRTIAVNWACSSKIQSCLENTNKRIKDFIDNQKLIEPNLQSVIYCNGLKSANDIEFNYLYQLLMKSFDQAERQLLIASLGCSENSKQLKKFVESTIEKSSNENTLRAQEKLTILKSVYSKSEIGFTVTVEFLMKKFNEYADLTLGFSQINPLNDAVHGLASYVINKNQKKQVEGLIQKVKGHPKFDQKLIEMTAEKIENNLKWIESNREVIFKWMTKYQQEKSSANHNFNNRNIFTAIFLTFLIYFIF